ncbi:hypothetical protein ACFQY5_20470 [Paeniroseomonas aquatica]|uniref:hypothetical protein n=1 Tax=Paeniroseomonas aquatica TaxID=373043 RepID=UPI0036169B8C
MSKTRWTSSAGISVAPSTRRMAATPARLGGGNGLKTIFPVASLTSRKNGPRFAEPVSAKAMKPARLSVMPYCFA